jgi:hypothetical protein
MGAPIGGVGADGSGDCSSSLDSIRGALMNLYMVRLEPALVRGSIKTNHGSLFVSVLACALSLPFAVVAPRPLGAVL